MEPAAWVSGAGGAVRRSEATRAGISWRQLGGAVRAGALCDLGGGTFAIPNAPLEVVAAVTRSASLACISALRYRGVESLRVPRRVHLTAQRGAPGGRVEWHRGPRDGLVIDLPRAAAQVLRCCSAIEALVAIDSLLRTERCGKAEILGELSRNVGGRARWLLHHATGRAGSVLESALRYHLLMAGVPPPVLQAPIQGVGHVDFLIAGWLIVETDGWETHGDRISFEVDRDRDAVAATQGFRTLRFTWDAVRYRPVSVMAKVLAVLRSGPPSGTPTVTDSAGMGLL